MRYNRRLLLTVAAMATVLSAATRPGVAETPYGEAALSFGGTLGDRANGIATDAAGNLYVTGYFSGAVDLDPGPGTASLTSAGGNDAFVCKLDASGALLWARSVGGAGSDISYAVGVDGAGGVYLTGFFEGTADFEPGAGAFDLTSAGAEDAFVCVLDNAGAVTWARRFGGTGNDRCFDAVPDGSGGAYVTGHFTGTVDLDPGAGLSNATSAGGLDAYILRLDGSGDLLWAYVLGGAADDRGFAVETDAAGNLLATGYFQGSPDVDPGPDELLLASAGAEDAYVLKLSPAGELVWAAPYGGTAADEGRAVLEDGLGRVLLAGGFEGNAGSTALGPNADLASAGDQDAFLLRLELIPGTEGETEGEGEPEPPSPGMPVAAWPAILAFTLFGAITLRNRRAA